LLLHQELLRSDLELLLELLQRLLELLPSPPSPLRLRLRM
jgi:hypothetical protein